ncbi:MAG: helix-turn-helix transcriptional regulator [Lentisphaeria bacterium]|nr:helix-turn-helix transcriptional regulator [Lentisphaeria bacterium]
MNYYDGLTFPRMGSEPQYRKVVINSPLYYGIQFNYHGTLRLKIGNRKEFFGTGSCAFLTYPGEIFEYGPVEDQPRHHNFICVCGPRMEQYLSGGLFKQDSEHPLIQIENGEKFYQTMQNIMIESRINQVPSPRMVFQFEDLLLQMHESSLEGNKPMPYQAAGLNDLIKRICSEPEKNWDFNAEAENFYVTPTHFRRIFKQLTGLPPQQFVIQNRLHKAAAMLASTKESVNEIAYRTGWENVFYFSRQFRQKYHASPLQYRKEFIVRS